MLSHSYQATQEAMGWEPVVRSVRAAYRSGCFPAAAAHIPDEKLDSFPPLAATDLGTLGTQAEAVRGGWLFQMRSRLCPFHRLGLGGYAHLPEIGSDQRWRSGALDSGVRPTLPWVRSRPTMDEGPKRLDVEAWSRLGRDCRRAMRPVMAVSR